MISEYLQLEATPNDKIETRCLAHRAKGYLIHDGELYHRSTSGIIQWCIPVEGGKVLLLDIQEGICGLHDSSRSMRKGFLARLLLADVDRVFKTGPLSSLRAPDHPRDVVVCCMGPRSPRTLQESTRGA
jgi:hypothetical protein